MSSEENSPRHKKDRRGLKGLLAVSGLHFINDLHPTLLPTFLPEIVRRLDLSYGQAGFLSTMFGVLNLIVQPIAGHLADRQKKPVFALWAPLFTAAGAYLLPIAPNYATALLFISIMSVGTASFHPQGHGLTGIVGGNKHLGSYLAIFAAAGTLGAALSPLYGIFLIKTVGAKLMPGALVLVLAAILAAKALLPKSYVDEGQAVDRGDKNAVDHSKDSVWAGLTRVMLLCWPLVLIAIIRDSTSQGIRVFLPLLITGQGGSIDLAGTILFAFTAAGSAANLVGGKLADMFGKRRIIIMMMILAPAFLFPAIKASGLAAIILFVLGGACIAATSPVTLAMAQEAVPDSRSTASSLVMGVAWGMANIVASPIGKLADHIGLDLALSFVALCPLGVATVMILQSRRKRSAAD